MAQAETARLEEARLACLEDRIDADLAAGRHADLVGELEALVDEQPLRQRLRAQAMLALYRSGRDAEALEVYQDARRVLVEELGIEPRREIRDLQQAILRQDPALDLRADAAAPDSARGPFVGRENELEELLSGFEETLAGRGRLILLVGEPGIGKSRLADELVSRVRARGGSVLVGRCWEAGGAPAYWPWVQSLRGYIRATDATAVRLQLGSGAAILAQLLPELRQLFPDLPEPPALESEGARFRLFEAASAFLKSAAQSRPLLLVLDDLHAADEPSLLLLQFLARELDDSRLLVVGAYRSVDPTPTDRLTAAVTELAREPVTRSLDLVGLDEHDARRYIELTSGESPSDELVAAIHEETEGNPLFVGEIVRLLAREGGFSDAEVPRLAIPQSVRDVIARRLRYLSEECNRLLVLASVLGREFALETLARVAHVTEDELLETLDEAMAAGVVSDVPGSPGQLRFAHVLIRDTLYEGLTTARRVRLHRLAVEALEAIHGRDPGPHLAELAYHCSAGSDFDKALHYAQSAADYALGLLAYEEAARLYETALDVLPLSALEAETTRCELLLSLGEAEIMAGNSQVARDTFLAAAEIARHLGLGHQLARAAAGYGGRITWGRAGSDERIVGLLEEGLAALGQEEVELRIRLLARLAGALRDEPERDRRDRISREAVDLARRSGSAAALAHALDGRLGAIVAPDTIDERLILADELCAEAKLGGQPERRVAGHHAQFIARLELCDMPSAEAELAEAKRIAEELHQPAHLWQVAVAEAMLALAKGRFDHAEEMIDKALALGERSIDVFAVPAYQVQRYQLLVDQSRFEELEQLEPLLRTTAVDYPTRPVIRCALIHLHTVLGRTEEVRRELGDLAKDGFAAIPFDIEWLYAMSLLAETCSAVGGDDSAAALYASLSPHATLNAVDVPEGFRGSVSRYLGLLAATLGRLDDAARHFETALEVNESMGARPWLAHTQSDYAQMLNELGERARASELVGAAIATYRSLGMESHAAKSSKLVRKVSAEIPSSQAARSG